MDKTKDTPRHAQTSQGKHRKNKRHFCTTHLQLVVFTSNVCVSDTNEQSAVRCYKLVDGGLKGICEKGVRDCNRQHPATKSVKDCTPTTPPIYGKPTDPSVQWTRLRRLPSLCTPKTEATAWKCAPKTGTEGAQSTQNLGAPANFGVAPVLVPPWVSHTRNALFMATTTLMTLFYAVTCV